MESRQRSRTDPISEALRLVKVDTTVVFRAVFSAPWGIGFGPHLGPVFHVVTDGGCSLEVDGRPGELRLSTGDLVMLPTGQRHWIRDQSGTPVSSFERVLACVSHEDHGLSRYGGLGGATWMVCGGFTVEGGPAHPVLGLLPTMIHVSNAAGRPAPWVAATIDQLAVENASNRPGAQVVVNRLADALLTQVLRAALAEADSRATHHVGALRDPSIGRAIELIHRSPERSWAVGRLAYEVALSRSAFASRFRKLVGETPRSYLRRTRLVQAATMLQATDSRLAKIALRAGYAGPFSFSKAFKRNFGLSPDAYRGLAARAVPGLRKDGSRRDRCGGHLSPRQQELVVLVAQGLTNKEIAALLRISLHTTKEYLRGVFEKTGLRTRAAVAAMYAKSGAE